MDFTLREWQKSDAQGIVKYANNQKIAAQLRNSFPHPYTEKDAQWFISSCLEADQGKNVYRAICVNDEAVGSIGLLIKDDVLIKSAEIGYWLAEPFWGNGIATRAVQSMCEYGFSHFDIVRIYALIFASNGASRRVLEKAGFHMEGLLEKSIFKHSQFFDACIYALLKN